MDLLFNGLLAKLFAILDSFFINTTSEVGWSGVVESYDSGGLNTRQAVTLPNGPICALHTTKGNNITSQLCENLQPGGFSLTTSRAN